MHAKRPLWGRHRICRYVLLAAALLHLAQDGAFLSTSAVRHATNSPLPDGSVSVANRLSKSAQRKRLHSAHVAHIRTHHERLARQRAAHSFTGKPFIIAVLLTLIAVHLALFSGRRKAAKDPADPAARPSHSSAHATTQTPSPSDGTVEGDSDEEASQPFPLTAGDTGQAPPEREGTEDGVSGEDPVATQIPAASQGTGDGPTDEDLTKSPTDEDLTQLADEALATSEETEEEGSGEQGDGPRWPQRKGAYQIGKAPAASEGTSVATQTPAASQGMGDGPTDEDLTQPADEALATSEETEEEGSDEQGYVLRWLQRKGAYRIGKAPAASEEQASDEEAATWSLEDVADETAGASQEVATPTDATGEPAEERIAARISDIEWGDWEIPYHLQNEMDDLKTGLNLIAALMQPAEHIVHVVNTPEARASLGTLKKALAEAQSRYAEMKGMLFGGDGENIGLLQRELEQIETEPLQQAREALYILHRDTKHRAEELMTEILSAWQIEPAGTWVGAVERLSSDSRLGACVAPLYSLEEYITKLGVSAQEAYEVVLVRRFNDEGNSDEFSEISAGLSSLYHKAGALKRAARAYKDLMDKALEAVKASLVARCDMDLRELEPRRTLMEGYAAVANRLQMTKKIKNSFVDEINNDVLAVEALYQQHAAELRAIASRSTIVDVADAYSRAKAAEQKLRKVIDERTLKMLQVPCLQKLTKREAKLIQPLFARMAQSAVEQTAADVADVEALLMNITDRMAERGASLSDERIESGVLEISTSTNSYPSSADRKARGTARKISRMGKSFKRKVIRAFTRKHEQKSKDNNSPGMVETYLTGNWKRVQAIKKELLAKAHGAAVAAKKGKRSSMGPSELGVEATKFTTDAWVRAANLRSEAALLSLEHELLASWADDIRFLHGLVDLVFLNPFDEFGLEWPRVKVLRMEFDSIASKAMSTMTIQEAAPLVACMRTSTFNMLELAYIDRLKRTAARIAAA